MKLARTLAPLALVALVALIGTLDPGAGLIACAAAVAVLGRL